MTFQPGDRVHVANFGKAVVREVRNGGRYLVDVKGHAMVVSETQLAPMDARKSLTPETPPPAAQLPVGLARQHVPTSIDLHGMTSDEAIAAVDGFLDAAILAGHEEVRIIHGRSGGRLRAAVHGRLRTLLPAGRFRLDETNPGVTIVVL